MFRRRLHCEPDYLRWASPGSEVIRRGYRVSYNIPPKRTTQSSQRARNLISENDDIVGLEGNDKVIAIASD